MRCIKAEGDDEYNKIKIKRDGTMNKLLISLVAIGCLAAAFG